MGEDFFLENLLARPLRREEARLRFVPFLELEPVGRGAVDVELLAVPERVEVVGSQRFRLMGLGVNITLVLGGVLSWDYEKYWNGWVWIRTKCLLLSVAENGQSSREDNRRNPTPKKTPYTGRAHCMK